MSLGMAPFAVVLLLVGQAAPKGDKDFEVPAAFTKKVPETVQDLKDIEAHVKALTKKVMPAIVSVRIGNASGSGIIIDAEGHVLTAGHVSGAPDRPCVVILPDGRTLKGKTLGANQGIDSGMIVITEKAEFPHGEMSKSAGLKRGDWCLAIGHPGGFQKGRSPVVRVGRLLDVNRSFLRSDCTLVGGDSGGPLFDMSGKVIGIHSRIGNQITQNMHVPIDTYRDSFEKLAKAEIWGPNIFGGAKSKGDPYLGIKLDGEAKGCKIQAVDAQSPAEKAGLKPDDMIEKFDGKSVASVDEFLQLIRKKSPNNIVALDIRRGEETLQLRVTIGKKPA